MVEKMDFVLERREKDKNRSHTNPAQIKDISTLIHNFIVLFVHRILFFCFFFVRVCNIVSLPFCGIHFFSFYIKCNVFFFFCFFPNVFKWGSIAFITISENKRAHSTTDSKRMAKKTHNHNRNIVLHFPLVFQLHTNVKVLIKFVFY